MKKENGNIQKTVMLNSFQHLHLNQSLSKAEEILNQVQDDNRQQGFTLIELLVVVLIIGILAAVAVPQYQKAVAKARLTEVMTRIPAIEKAMDLYVLEHGYEDVSFFGNGTAETGIDIKAGLETVFQEGTVINGVSTGPAATPNSQAKGFVYYGDCVTDGNRCFWTIVNDKWTFVLEGERSEGASWMHYCEYDEGDAVATTLCKQLQAQGWKQGDLFF